MKKPAQWMAFSLFIASFFGLSSWAQNGPDFIERTEFGVINWSQYLVQATGIGTLTEKRVENTHPVALETAKQAARENILRVIQQLRVNSENTVSDALKKNSGIEPELRRLVQNARVVKQAYLSDGTAKIVMELSLLGAFSQLVLPQEIKQIESVKPIVPPENLPALFTGLIVDATGIDVKPALVPKIVDENRKEVFGTAFASRESAVQQGMCRYVPDLASARKQNRVGNHPLVVKGLKTEAGGKTTIIISTADGAKLKSASEHLQLLRKCFVVIAIDPVTH